MEQLSLFTRQEGLIDGITKGWQQLQAPPFIHLHKLPTAQLVNRRLLRLVIPGCAWHRIAENGEQFEQVHLALIQMTPDSAQQKFKRWFMGKTRQRIGDGCHG